MATKATAIENDSKLPASLRSGARENETSRAVRSLRKERDAELAALKQNKIHSMQEKLFKSEGKESTTTYQHSAIAEGESVVAKMRKTLDKKKDNLVPVSMEGFYGNQRAKSAGDKEQKAQAAETLRTFKSQVDTREYRAFVLAIHINLGILLLQKQHSELPGGHVEDYELLEAAKFCDGDKIKETLAAGKIAAGRMLHQQTGVNINNDLNRFQLVILRSENKNNREVICQHRRRLFYFVMLTDDDFPVKLKDQSHEDGFVSPSSSYGHNLQLKLSKDYSGFTFEKEIRVAANNVNKHSNGACKEALVKIINFQKFKDMNLNNIFSLMEIQNRENTQLHIDFKGNTAYDEEPDQEKTKGCFACFFPWQIKEN